MTGRRPDAIKAEIDATREQLGRDGRRAQRPAGRPGPRQGECRPGQGHRRRDLPGEPAGGDRRGGGPGGTGGRSGDLAPEARGIARMAQNEEEALSKGAKLAYRPIGLIGGILAGTLSGIVFKQVWKLVAKEDDAPTALQSEYSMTRGRPGRRHPGRDLRRDEGRDRPGRRPRVHPADRRVAGRLKEDPGRHARTLARALRRADTSPPHDRGALPWPAPRSARAPSTASASGSRRRPPGARPPAKAAADAPASDPDRPPPGAPSPEELPGHPRGEADRDPVAGLEADPQAGVGREQGRQHADHRRRRGVLRLPGDLPGPDRAASRSTAWSPPRRRWPSRSRTCPRSCPTSAAHAHQRRS